MRQQRTFRRRAVAVACSALLSLGIGARLSAQVSTYQGFYGGTNVDEAKGGVIYTLDDHYVSVGLTRSTSSNSDVLVVKTDRCGNIVWSNRYNIANGNDIGRKVRQASNGDYVIVGTTTTTTNGGDAFLMRINSAGTLVWARTYGAAVTEDNGNDLRIDATGNIYVAGDTRSAGAGGTDGWIFKTGSTGIQAWSKTYGGTSQDLFNALDFSCGSTNLVAVGQTMSPGTSDRDIYAVSVVMASGAITWSRQYGQDENEEWANTVVCNGSYLYIGGVLLDNPAILKGLIMRIDCPSGGIWTQKAYTHPNPALGHESEIFELQVLPSTAIVAVGQWRNPVQDLWMMDVNATTLNVISSALFGTAANDDAGRAVAVTTDDPFDYNVITAGYSQNGPFGNPDLYMVSTDLFLWIQDCATEQEIRMETPDLNHPGGPETTTNFPNGVSLTPVRSGYGSGRLVCPTCVEGRAPEFSPELSYSAGTTVDVDVVAVSLPAAP